MAGDVAEDLLILVDSEDNEQGHLPKVECHLGAGLLHRAFSIHIFNSKGQVLIQQRSSSKALWPNYWSNSCCSHPRKGEKIMEAVNRRLFEELGLPGSSCDISFLYKFQYQASYNTNLAENELCHVYIGFSDSPVKIAQEEIAAVEYVEIEQLSERIKLSPEKFTPWFKSEWQTMISKYKDRFLCN